MRLKIAIRNTFRNFRRTSLNVFMIASGVASIVVFKGYSTHLLKDIKEGIIATETGHLQLATQAHWDNTMQSQREGFIADPSKVISELKKVPGVVSVSGRLGFYGLLAHGERTQSTRGISLDIAAESKRAEVLNVSAGDRLHEGNSDSIIVGVGLANSLGIKPGADVTILGFTNDNVINAIDAKVAGLMLSGMAEIDNTSYIIPLKAAQRLLDTDSVERVVVQLDSSDLVEPLKNRIEQVAKGVSPELRVRTWRQLAKLYYEVEGFFMVYNRMIQGIILTLVLVGILNTVGMSIFERTGEIGTLRALGDTEESLVRQFVLEGLVLGIVGGAVGLVLAVALAQLLNWLQIPVVLPGASKPLPIRIELLPLAMVEALVLTMATAILASFIPAVRATRIEIVEALRKNT